MQSAEWVSDVKLHMGTLGVGSHDNKVYLYDVNGKGAAKLKGKCAKHNSYITHLDFSQDGKFVQSNCGGYEVRGGVACEERKRLYTSSAVACF